MSRVRRSVIFVPGSEPRKLEKCRSFPADCLLLDLEDSVAPEKVALARSLVSDFLRRTPPGSHEHMVRIHGVLTPHFHDDLQAILPARPDAIVIPKVNGPAEVQLVDELVSMAERAQELPPGTIRLLVIIETARGLVEAFHIASASPRLDGLILGHADLAMTLGIQERMALDGVIRYARHHVVIAARAADKEAYDMVFLQLADLEGLRREALEGRHIGYSGKLVVHPAHIEPVNAVYTPTPEEVSFAVRVLDGYAAAIREGRAVFTVDGRMIDLPIVDVERRVLDRAQRAGVLPPGTLPAGVAGDSRPDSTVR